MRTRTPQGMSGFSLIELSIVILIFSTVAVLGLEAANQLLKRRAYAATQAQLQSLDEALVKFYRVYGRLPCPADRTFLPTNTSYGIEGICTSGDPTRAGMIPFRTLNLPVAAAMDGYNNRINYVVTRVLAIDSASFAMVANKAEIEVRNGTLQEPCGAACSVLANPATSSGAAYILFSNGEDKRGAISQQGVAATACYTTTADTRIDTQNCALGALTVGIANTVYYDSRYNNAGVAANYFDDVVVWRGKGRVM